MTTLIMAVLAGLPLYVAFSLARPTKRCRRCGGWGSKPSRRRRAARRHCRGCDGTGRRFRAAARLAYAIRGARRRHAQLALRAAEQAAEASLLAAEKNSAINFRNGSAAPEREQVRS